MGPAVRRFEEKFAEAVGARHAVSCSSGTAALHLAAIAAGLGDGDLAIVPSLTFLATANCARYVGADVVFADVDPRTGLMGAEHLEAALARAPAGRVKAVLPVHLNGQCGDIDRIRDIANANGLTIIEDACHALGTTWAGADGKTSTIGACAKSDMAAFSFHPVKTIAAGEAGAVTTNDEKLYRKLALACSHGMTRDAAAFETRNLAFDSTGAPNPWYYEMSEFGFNYRLSDIHAALGTSQLAKMGRFAARRRSLAQRYDELIKPLAPLVRSVARTPGCDPVWHLYVVQIDFAAAGISRAALMNMLKTLGIGTQVHYLPVHLQPYYQRRYGALDLPGARAYYDRALSLPLFPAMSDGDVEHVVGALRDCFRAAKGVEAGS
jgi:UDP-4-amino-4,6-dideoxy-N-acetyl-beta-L-altrosamine transaminase